MDVFSENIEDNLRTLIKSERISKDDDIIFFGANKSTLMMMEMLSGYNFVAIVDNDVRKNGQIIGGVKVYNPESFLVEFNPNYRILIASEYYAAMRKQLETFGYSDNKEIFILWHGNRYYSTDEETFSYHVNKVRHGEEVYANVVRECNSSYIFICPYAGTGDMYIIGMYLDDYAKSHDIKEYVVVVPNNNCKRILHLFDINAYVANEIDADCLMMYCRIRGFDVTHSKVLNDGFNQIMVKRMRGIKDNDFHSMFRKVLFDNSEAKVNYALKQVSADDIFEQYSLRKGRTILLSPYANTITKIEDEFWVDLARRFKEMDYDVVTNSSGESEPPICGTVGVFIPYNKIVSFLNDAGYFVGVRSGLCDIISSTKAKMAVLYPYGNVFGACSTYDYFSLEKMELKLDGLLELVYTETCVEKNKSMIDDIVNLVCND